MNIYFSVLENPVGKSRQRELALYLLDYALERDFNAKRGEIIIGEYGKPYFADSQIKFNYSHCKYGAACAVSKEEVGVDIQEIRAVKPAVIRRVCCVHELELIKSDDDFTKMWTLKEAYAKFTGKGFAEGFKNIDTTAFSKEFAYKYNHLYIACYHSTGVTPQWVQASPP